MQYILLFTIPYLIVALIQLQIDAAICYCCKRPPNLFIAIIIAAFWPVAVPLMIWHIYRNSYRT